MFDTSPCGSRQDRQATASLGFDDAEDVWRCPLAPIRGPRDERVRRRIDTDGGDGSGSIFDLSGKHLAETFILSFSLPNFRFQAVTAYDILRSRGVPIGKGDYEGRLRTRARGRNR